MAKESSKRATPAEMAAGLARRTLENQAFLMDSLANEGMLDWLETGLDRELAEDRAGGQEYVREVARELRAIAASVGRP